MSWELVSTFASECYLTLVTYHALLFMFWFVMPFTVGVFANALLPLSLATTELSFPRLNNGALTLLLAALGLLSAATTHESSYGWTLYPPLSLTSALGCVIVSLHLNGLSSLLSSLNILTTVTSMSSSALDPLSLSLLCSAITVTALLLLLAMPVLTACITFLLLDALIHTQFYTLTGDCLLYAHLFWFFGHPEVYILALPILGMVNEYIATYSRRLLFGHISMIYSMCYMAAVGVCVWGHHMFTMHLDLETRAFFLTATLIIAVPTAIKLFNWLLTLANGSLTLSLPILASTLFLLVFLIGGLTGIVLANAALTLLFHDTYYVVAHFHYILSMAIILMILTAIFLFLEVFDLKLILGVFFIAINLTFAPMHCLGFAALPRSYADLVILAYTPWMAVGAILTLLAILLLAFQLTSSQLTLTRI